MKGSPMKRNFGIGADSPVKQQTWPGKPDPTEESPEQKAKRKETFNKAFEKSKKKGGKKDFKDMKPGDLGKWGDAPLKQMKPGDITDEQKADRDAKFMKDREKSQTDFKGERKHGLKTLPIEERARLSEERGDKEKREEFMRTMKKKSPAKDYSMKKGSHNHPHSPAKQKKSGLFQKTHDEEIAEKNKSDKKYMENLDKKRKKKAQEDIDAINKAYLDKMNYSTDSLNVANQSYETQQMKDYRTMSASEYQKKYGKK